jgi:hypothetical protein
LVQNGAQLSSSSPIISKNGGVMVAAGGGNMVAAGGGKWSHAVAAYGGRWWRKLVAAGGGEHGAAGAETLTAGMVEMRRPELLPRARTYRQRSV